MKIPIRSGATGFRVRPKANGKPCPAALDGDVTSTPTKELSESAILAGFMNGVLAAFAEQWASPAATLWRYEKQWNVLCLHALYRRKGAALGKASRTGCSLGRCLNIGPLWQELSSLRLPTTLNVADNRWVLLRKLISVGGMERLLLIPLRDEKDILGLIGVALAESKGTETDTIKTARLLSQQIVAAWKLADLLNGKVHSGIREERKRIARDLHDSLAQSFTSILIQADLAEEMVLRSAEQARQHLLRMRQLAHKGLIDVRRALFGLRPRSWEKCCLVEAIEQLTAEFNAAGDGVRAEFYRRESMPDLPMATQGQVLRIVQESLANVLKHASAAKVRIELVASVGSLELNILDNGAGFDPTGMPGGFGIRGMQERASLMGGRLRVSSSTGRGTQVRLIVPLEAGNHSKKSA